MPHPSPSQENFERFVKKSHSYLMPPITHTHTTQHNTTQHNTTTHTHVPQENFERFGEKQIMPSIPLGLRSPTFPSLPPLLT